MDQRGEPTQDPLLHEMDTDAKTSTKRVDTREIGWTSKFWSDRRRRRGYLQPK